MAACLVVAVLVGVVTLAPAMTPTTAALNERFAYICNKAVPDLCLGISPGPADPVYGMVVQLKSKSQNIAKNLDSRKMRWDIDDFGHLELLNNATIMCVDKTADASKFLSLQACDQTSNGPWTWDPKRGVLRYGDGTMCATAHSCRKRNDPSQSCDPTTGAVARSRTDFNDLGMVIHLNACFDSGAKGSNANTMAQQMTLVWDCAAGCSPELLQNAACDEACNNVQCAFDKGLCTRSPTVAGQGGGEYESPTSTPTVQPAAAPITTTTGAPTTPKPPTSPTTKSPTPSAGRGVDETGKEGLDEGMGPATAYVVLFLFMLLFMCCFALMQRRRAQRRRKLEADAEMVGNDAAFGAGGAAFHLSHHGTPSGARAGGGANGNGGGDSPNSFVTEPPFDPFRGDARFASGSAVALNQLKYHSRAAGAATVVPSDNASQVSATSAMALADPADRDKKAFVEVRMV